MWRYPPRRNTSSDSRTVMSESPPSPSFFAVAIKDWKSVARALVLLLASVALLATLIGLSIYWILPVTDKIEVEGVALTFHQGGKQVSVVWVPANQLAVPTGVRLDPKKAVKVASMGGLVLTIGGLKTMRSNTLSKLSRMIRALRDKSSPIWTETRIPGGG